jgi:hypothetical protein
MGIASMWWTAVAIAALALPCQAGARKCTDAGGRVSYQDVHCSREAAPADAGIAGTRVADKPKADSARREQPAHGAWRGAAQFRYVSGAPPDASADAAIELDLLPDGRLQGGAIGTGCRLDGVHAPQRANNQIVMAVDITVSGCRDARFNARYAGRLDTATPARSRLSLHAITAASPVTAEGYLELSMATIDATLRR